MRAYVAFFAPMACLGRVLWHSEQAHSSRQLERSTKGRPPPNVWRQATATKDPWQVKRHPTEEGRRYVRNGQPKKSISLPDTAKSSSIISRQRIPTAQASSRREVISALGCLVAAATFTANADKARATQRTDGLKDGLQRVEVPPESSETPESSAPVTDRVDLSTILKKSAKEVLAAGEAGFVTGLLKALSLTWLYTANYYQYRYGGNLQSTLKTLVGKDGFFRLYQGLPFQLVYGPLLNLGDNAANIGVADLLDVLPETADIPKLVKSAAAAFVGGLWVVLIQPIDFVKTIAKVEGEEGLQRLKQKFIDREPIPFFQGWLPSTIETVGKNYPLFLTYNYLALVLPTASKDEVTLALLRSALIGVTASLVAESATNSFRVVKTYQQMAGSEKADPSRENELGQSNREGSEGEMTIREALAIVLETDGIKGLFGRGLDARLLLSVIEGAIFGVLLKYFQVGEKD